MNILFLSHFFYPDIGGIEVNSEILAKEFSATGHKVCLVTWSKNSDKRAFSFSVVRCPDPCELLRLHRWADVVYENNPCLRLSWPALLLGKPSVIALRTYFKRQNGRNSIKSRIKQMWLSRATGVIAVSESVRESCWQTARVIGNPFRFEEFRILPNIFRDRAFVFLGRLVPTKGVDIAIKALHRLDTSFSCISKEKIKLTIIGDGPDRPRLEALATKLGIMDQVQFTGFLRGMELVRCLNRHYFLLVPSQTDEPFGNVALEGMACGCVPIVSDCGGLPDAIGNAGLTFIRGDVSDLTKCMTDILNQEELVNMLRSAAPNHLQNHLPQVVAKQYLKVIERAC